MNRSTLYGTLAAVLVVGICLAKLSLNTPAASDTPPETPAVASEVAPAAGEHPVGESLQAVSDLVEDVTAGLSQGQRNTPAGGEPPEPSPTDQTITGLGTVLNPVTGGLSSIIAGLVIGIGKLGREVKARGDAIVEIHDNPDTPPAYRQTRTMDAAETVERVRLKRNKKAGR